MVENDGNSQEEFGVDSGALEDLIDVGSVAKKLAGKPADSSLLALQFFLDKLSDVQGELLRIGISVV